MNRVYIVVRNRYSSESSMVSFFLGAICAISLIGGATLWSSPFSQLSFWTLSMSSFHFLEFFIVSVLHPDECEMHCTIAH